MIHFIQPFSYDLDIGKAYNEAISRLPNEWVCITDQDTLKFKDFALRVKELVNAADKNCVITCKTNRLRKQNKCVHLPLYDNVNIDHHYAFYNKLWERYGTEFEPTNNIPGMFMLFHKSVWEKVKFVENDIRFDMLFTHEARRKGYKILLSKGLYIFHLYRWGETEPEKYLQHLIKNK